MITAAQLANLSNVMPGTFPVTYHVLAADGSFAAGATVNQVEKRPATTRDMATGTLEARNDYATFHAWTKQLGAIEPKPGDYFTDPAGVKWQILPEGATAELLGQRWRLRCIVMVEEGD